MQDPWAPRPSDPRPLSSDEEVEAEPRRSTRARKKPTPYSPGKVRACPAAPVGVCQAPRPPNLPSLLGQASARPTPALNILLRTHPYLLVRCVSRGLADRESGVLVCTTCAQSPPQPQAVSSSGDALTSTVPRIFLETSYESGHQLWLSSGVFCELHTMECGSALLSSAVTRHERADPIRANGAARC